MKFEYGAALTACCLAVLISSASPADAGVIGLAAAPEPALAAEAACLLKYNFTAKLLTISSACAHMNATISASGVDLMCSASCRSQLAKVNGTCRNDLVAGTEFGATFQRVFDACNITYSADSASSASFASAASGGSAAAVPGIAPAVPVPYGGPAEAPAPNGAHASQHQVGGAALVAAVVASSAALLKMM